VAPEPILEEGAADRLRDAEDREELDDPVPHPSHVRADLAHVSDGVAQGYSLLALLAAEVCHISAGVGDVAPRLLYLALDALHSGVEGGCDLGVHRSISDPE
jgi:hypothetical protein